MTGIVCCSKCDEKWQWEEKNEAYLADICAEIHGLGHKQDKIIELLNAIRLSVNLI